MQTLKSHLDCRWEQERGGQQINLQTKQREASEPEATPLPPDNGSGEGGSGLRAGSAPEQQGGEARGNPRQTRERQEQKASRRKEKGGQGSSERPAPPLRVKTGRQSLHHGRAGTRGVRAAPARGGCRQLAEHQPGPPPGKPGAEKPCGSGTPGAATLPCPSGLPEGRGHKGPGFREGWGLALRGGRSPRSWGGCTSHSGPCPAGS